MKNNDSTYERGTMRVAQILRKYDPREWGGTETALRELLRGLRENDTESVVFAPNPQKPVDPDKDVLRNDGFEVQRFRAFLPVFGANDIDRKRLLAVGGNIMSFDAPLRLLQEPSLDVIHTHALNRLGGIARIVARKRRIPFVATIHGGYLDLPSAVAEQLAAPTRSGIDYGKPFGWLLRSRHVLEDADAVITVNPREAQLLRAKFPALRVEVIPHGIPFAHYVRDHREEAERFIPAIRGRTVLLIVGRIDGIKNQGFVVDLMPEVKRLLPNSLLLLVGPETDAEHARYVRSRIRERGLENSVLVPGPLAPNDKRLIGLYQCAHVALLPSLTETFGLVLFEAWAAGCPVIASATTGAKQVVREGENGFLFQHGDAPSFFHALRCTLESEERRKALGYAGQTLVRSHFDTAVCVRRTRDLYAELRKTKQRNKDSVRIPNGATP